MFSLLHMSCKSFSVYDDIAFKGLLICNSQYFVSISLI